MKYIYRIVKYSNKGYYTVQKYYNSFWKGLLYGWISINMSSDLDTCEEIIKNYISQDKIDLEPVTMKVIKEFF